eukprot:TRINITY_DN3110_c1_g1_i1.p1 TRINITY_DN3110_c1_g1~~TRINITY_DN3110_c1_g1_i1.p1  ORF type:complete len:416 (+),score=44.39 TRINITY_DN3110_c1_g1_i1:108-1355(+)
MVTFIGGFASGVTAALLAPLFMALGFIVWDTNWKSGGGSAFALNLFKCNLASIGFVVACLIWGFAHDDDSRFAEESPFTVQSVGFLVLSSFLGIFVGDSAWLEALRLLGATRVLVCDTLKPFIVALLGWAVLGEELHPAAFGGIALTACGVLVVSLEKEKVGEIPDLPDAVVEDDGETRIECSKNDVTVSSTDKPKTNAADAASDLASPVDEQQCKHAEGKHIESSLEGLSPDQFQIEEVRPARKERQCMSSSFRRGYAFAIGNILFDSYGSLLTKQHGVGMTSWAINLIRFGFAGILLLVTCVAFRLYERCRRGQKLATSGAGPAWYRLPALTRIAWVKISFGVCFVTFLCPALSNYALFQVQLALAITLGSVTPLYAMALDWPLKGIRPTLRGSFGAAMAVGGVVILSVFRYA